MATTHPSTAHYLAILDPDQQLIDATILELVEQLRHAQRDILAYVIHPPGANQYARQEQLAWYHLDADLELLGRHSFPYFEEVDG